MIIGTLRPEEAKVFDGDAGYHRLSDGSSVEVFWTDGELTGTASCDEYNLVTPGWYWWACLPGCLPDGEASGPFGTSYAALADAQPEE